ncbi:hypothetical protein SLNWT_0226 [Streptomyces albus]|uniref:Uncharacterized protein n=1 Tax=Streptomyces albus (strain ATCC 21838 / DSM 41398 / FERM P-419 / JCM 4703 / NBRC 107858) TaxID=1081613 RepID=A0A0B5ER26_STRA4|nr:hypothetical protein SLNWT_0226 [Streptomyces albus]AOU74915.1 hypothetical protein SLNHY_0224 [Streptomyces albus]AYN30724.1 hypothetical protein DUI70_0222 [Streptomyces albus]
MSLLGHASPLRPVRPGPAAPDATMPGVFRRRAGQVHGRERGAHGLTARPPVPPGHPAPVPEGPIPLSAGRRSHRARTRGPTAPRARTAMLLGCP